MTTEEKIDKLQQLINNRLKKISDSIKSPAILKKAMAHSLLSGGKRIRPMLIIATGQVFNKSPLFSLPAACAMEMIHTYSLIHDDLPAMDNDSLRRGVPSCHVAFGESTAILAGDALLTEAFNLIAKSYKNFPGLAINIILEISSASGCNGMVGGQILDIMKERPYEFKKYDGFNKENLDLIRIHSMKTGALFKACFTIGGLLGGANKYQMKKLKKCGELTGLAFQIIDDCLDATGTDQKLGKNAGSDARKGKETFVNLMGIENAKNYANLLGEKAQKQLDIFGENSKILKMLIKLVVERQF